MDKEKLFNIGVKKRNGELFQSWDELNKQYNYPFKNGDSFSRWMRKQIKKDNIQQDIIEFKDTIEIHSDGKQTSTKLIEMSNEQCKDINFLLEKHGFDKKDWELVNARNNFWNNYSKKDGIQILYSSKITVKPRIDNISLEEIEEHFEEFSKNYKKDIYIPKLYRKLDKMLEIPVMDVHLSKLGWKPEVGENYDYKIAEERFLHIIFDFIDKTKDYLFEKIIFPIGQDFFNFSTIDGTTIHGTRLDNDLRWQKVFLKGVEMLIKAIDNLSNKAPVEAFYVSGNHDKTTSYYAINYIYAWYRNNSNIKISIDPKSRKYVEFGNCLIGYTHGDTEKKRISGIMQVEARESWGRTLFHEWHMGHKHSEQTKEENGIIIRNISSITGTDAWHYENGYVGSIRKAQAFIWDKETGLETILNSVII